MRHSLGKTPPLMDVLSDFGASKATRFDDVSHLLGFPGKFGIDASEVEGFLPLPARVNESSGDYSVLFGRTAFEAAHAYNLPISPRVGGAHPVRSLRFVCWVYFLWISRITLHLPVI